MSYTQRVYVASTTGMVGWIKRKSPPFCREKRKPMSYTQRVYRRHGAPWAGTREDPSPFSRGDGKSQCYMRSGYTWHLSPARWAGSREAPPLFVGREEKSQVSDAW